MNGAGITMNWTDLLKRSVNAWIADKALRLSAALAYYAVFSIAPLLVITIAVAGMVLGDEAVAGQLKAEMKTYIGAPAAGALQSMVESAAKPGESVTATITGFVVLLLGASGVFSALKDALNTIWEVKPREDFDWRAFAREKVLNFGMVLVIGFLLLVSLLLSTAIAILNHRLEQVVELPPIVWTMATFVVSMAVATTLFAWIFKVLPDVRTHWRDVWTGAVLTALLFEIGKTALSWYLGRESTANAYGAAGSVVLLLLWVYYASCILLFGAEFTQVYAHARGRIIGPEVNAEWVGADERLHQGMDEHGHAGKEPPAMPQNGGPNKSPVLVPLQQDTGPKAALKHVVAHHPLSVMSAAFAIGLIPTLLMMQHRRVTRRAASRHQGVPVRPARRNTPGHQIVGEVARALIPLVLMPFIENAIERRFRHKSSSSSES
jgi:membrane protein